MKRKQKRQILKKQFSNSPPPSLATTSRCMVYEQQQAPNKKHIHRARGNLENGKMRIDAAEDSLLERSQRAYLFIFMSKQQQQKMTVDLYVRDALDDINTARVLFFNYLCYENSAGVMLVSVLI